MRTASCASLSTDARAVTSSAARSIRARTTLGGPVPPRRTAFTHTFFGISTTRGAVVMFASATIGIFYALAGLLVLTVRRWAAAVAIVLLIAAVAGRIALIATGLYPTGSLLNTVAIIAGTALWPNMYCLTAAGSTSASHTFAADALTLTDCFATNPLLI